MATINVREAEAGRVMDVACAKALGWIPPLRQWSEAGNAVVSSRRGTSVMYKTESVPNPRGGNFLFGFVMVGDDEVSQREFSWQYPEGYYRPLKNWSRRYSAAFELVEGADTFELVKVMDGWECFMYFLGKRWRAPCPIGGTSAPLAIARAFLLAHGVTEIEVDDEQD